MEKRGKPLAAANVAPLRTRRELPRIHVLDHAVTQRGGGIRTHRKLLPWMRLTAPRSSRQEAPPPIDDFYPGCRARRLVSLSVCYRGAISALRQFGKNMLTRSFTVRVESPGGISPPGAPRTVHDPLESHGSRCSAVTLNGFAWSPRAPPVSSWPVAKAEQRSPFAPAPLQGLPRYYGLLRPCSPLRYSRPRGWSRLRLVPSRRQRGEAQVLTFHTKAWSSFHLRPA